MFVGGIPRAAEDGVLQALFHRDAQVERRSLVGREVCFREGGFTRPMESEKLLNQELVLNGCKLRVAQWLPRGSRRDDESRPSRDEVKVPRSKESDNEVQRKSCDYYGSVWQDILILYLESTCMCSTSVH